MKTYLTALLSFLIAPVLAFGALDVTLSESSVVSVGGYSLVVSGSANFDSILVDSSSFSIQLSPGASITVTSSDRKAFTTSPTTYTTSQTCSSSQSLVTLAMVSGPVTTVTVTPSSSNCTLSEGGIVGGGGGGGGGGSAPTPVYTVIPGTSSSAASAVSSQASSVSQGATVTQTTTGPTTTKTISTLSGITITITKVLKIGSENSEVRQLQELLAKNPEIYPEGKVTGYFGSLTRKAVQNFQKKYGIVSSGNENTTGYGLVGPKTLAKIKEVFGTGATSSSSAQASSAASSVASAGTAVTITPSTTKAQQIQQIQTLINQLLEQIKALQAKKTTQ